MRDPLQPGVICPTLALCNPFSDINKYNLPKCEPNLASPVLKSFKPVLSHLGNHLYLGRVLLLLALTFSATSFPFPLPSAHSAADQLIFDLCFRFKVASAYGLDFCCSLWLESLFWPFTSDTTSSEESSQITQSKPEPPSLFVLTLCFLFIAYFLETRAYVPRRKGPYALQGLQVVAHAQLICPWEDGQTDG